MKLEDIRIRAIEPLYTPQQLKNDLPVPADIASTVAKSRKEIAEVIEGTDRRFLAIVGPCSIHDPREAFLYAQLLGKLRREVEDVLLLVMRVYFEKPRTTVGWKGLVTDPNLDGSDDIAKGLRTARAFLPRSRRTWSSRGDRVPRSHRAAIPGGSCLLGRHRRAYDRVANASRDVERPLHAGRI